MPHCVTCSKNLSTPGTLRTKLYIMAWTAVDMVSLGHKLLVHQAGLAHHAEEAGVVPVLTLAGQVLVKLTIVCKVR